MNATVATPAAPPCASARQGTAIATSTLSAMGVATAAARTTAAGQVSMATTTAATLARGKSWMNLDTARKHNDILVLLHHDKIKPNVQLQLHYSPHEPTSKNDGFFKFYTCFRH